MRQLINSSCIKSNQGHFLNAFALIEILEHVILGGYVTFGIVQLILITFTYQCGSDEFTIHKLNFALILLTGIRMASIVVLITSLMVCCLPCMFFYCFSMISQRRKK
jgi:hypothetical protein